MLSLTIASLDAGSRSQSLLSRLDRPSQANVRSTTHRCGSRTNPTDPGGRLPVMDADGDKLVLDLDPAPGGTAGQVFAWSNTGSRPLRVLAPSYALWLAGLSE